MLLKPQPLFFFKSGFDILAVAGVTYSHFEIIYISISRQIFVAFDTAYFDNFFVAAASARLVNNILTFLSKSIKDQISLLTRDPTYRGIDDALSNQIPLCTLSISGWFYSL